MQMGRAMSLLIKNPVQALPDLSGRTLVLQGSTGDLADVSWGDNKPAWILPRDILKFVHVPGHAPGRLALIHKPSHSLLLGDAVTHMNVTGSPTIALPPSPNMTQARQSLIHVAEQPGWQTAYPCHDHADGFSQVALKQFAASLSNKV